MFEIEISLLFYQVSDNAGTIVHLTSTHLQRFRHVNTRILRMSVSSKRMAVNQSICLHIENPTKKLHYIFVNTSSTFK